MKYNIISVVLCFVMLLSLSAANVSYAAEYNILDDNRNIVALPEGKASVDIENKNMDFLFDTSDKAEKGRAELTTSSFALEDSAIVISMETKFNEASESVFRRLSATSNSR